MTFNGNYYATNPTPDMYTPQPVQPQPQPTKTELRKENSVMKVMIIILLLVVVFIGGQSLSFKPATSGSNGAASVTSETAREQEAIIRRQLIEKLSAIMTLPSEEPQIVVVADKTKITDPALVSASNGDVIFAYSDRTIIYNPTTNKVVGVGPSVLKAAAAAGETAVAAPLAFTVDIYNGSNQKGFGNDFSKKIVVTDGNPKIGTIGTTISKNITTTTVYRMNPAVTDVAITAMLPAGMTFVTKSAADYPPIENKSTADVVVVLGQDQIK